MSEVPKPQDRGTYQGIMRARQGQAVELVAIMGGLFSLRFPDGAVIGCAPAAFKRS